MHKSLIIFLLLWPLAVWLWVAGQETVIETVVPNKYHAQVMPWHLWVYPWGYGGPYRKQGPYLRESSCRDAGLESLQEYMAQWPDVRFDTARYTCSQRCRFQIDGTDVRVCARVIQYGVSGDLVKESG